MKQFSLGPLILKRATPSGAWIDTASRNSRSDGVAFTFKQWGAWGPDGVRRDKKANGRALAGRSWDERPESSGTLL